MTKRGFIALLLVVIAVAGLSAGCGGGPPAVNGNTVKVHYTGTLSDGTVFDSSKGGDPIQFTLGANQMIPGFERAVYGMRVGESKTVTIPPEEAYGPRDDGLIVEISFEDAPDLVGVEVGQQIQMSTSSGRRVTVTVVKATPTVITVDANHHLAGEALTFEIKVVEIR